MKNFNNSDEILLDKLQKFTLRKNKDYKTQIEHSLKILSDVWQSTTPLMPYEYEIIEEYNDVVIAELKNKGTIKVNQ